MRKEYKSGLTIIMAVFIAFVMFFIGNNKVDASSGIVTKVEVSKDDEGVVPIVNYRIHLDLSDMRQGETRKIVMPENLGYDMGHYWGTPKTKSIYGIGGHVANVTTDYKRTYTITSAQDFKGNGATATAYFEHVAHINPFKVTEKSGTTRLETIDGNNKKSTNYKYTFKKLDDVIDIVYAESIIGLNKKGYDVYTILRANEKEWGSMGYISVKSMNGHSIKNNKGSYKIYEIEKITGSGGYTRKKSIPFTFKKVRENKEVGLVFNRDKKKNYAVEVNGVMQTGKVSTGNFFEIGMWKDSKKNENDGYARHYLYSSHTSSSSGGYVEVKDTKTDLHLEKKWDEPGTYGDIIRPESIKVDIKRGGKHYKTVTLKKSEGWKKTLKGVPNDINGILYHYTAEENEVNMYSTKVNSLLVNNGKKRSDGRVIYDRKIVITNTLDVPTIPEPKKAVSGGIEINYRQNILWPLNEVVTYKVTHNVASDFKYLKFSEYKFEDKIDEAWDIISAKVINGNNNRETKKFDIDITNNKVTATAKKNELNDNDFYGKDYILVIKVKAKDPEDLFWITKGEPTYQSTNKASVTINNETKDSNVVTTTIRYNPEDLYYTRCHHNKNNKEHKDEVIGVTKNDVTVTKGFLPSGSGKFEPKYSEYTNEAYNMIYNESQRPQVGWSEAQWNNWKDKFQNGSLKTNDVNLSSIKDIIQKNGGVLNITRTHHKSKMSVELCQKQVRTPNFETQEWEWHDKGGKEVHKIESPEYNISDEKDSYQILGVNCNVDGVNRIINDENLKDYEIEDHSYDTESGASRLLVVRPKEPGTPFPLGKINHYTGKDNFYKPDGTTWKNSCEQDFSKACKSTPLSGGNVKNDANNNLKETGTISQVKLNGNDEVGNYPPNENNQLMFFRDNKDRQVRADVWYLDKNDKTYSTDKNEAATYTDLKVLSGTPEIGITTISPWGETKEAIGEVNKDATFDRHVNRINVKSKWSSKANEPYKIGMTWTYKAKARNLGVVSIDGYNINESAVNEKEFNASCSFQKKHGSYQAVIPRNIFKDGNIHLDDKWKHSDTIEVVFTRSITDKITEKQNEQ